MKYERRWQGKGKDGGKTWEEWREIPEERAVCETANAHGDGALAKLQAGATLATRFAEYRAVK